MKGLQKMSRGLKDGLYPDLIYLQREKEWEQVRETFREKEKGKKGKGKE